MNNEKTKFREDKKIKRVDKYLLSVTLRIARTDTNFTASPLTSGFYSCIGNF